MSRLRERLTFANVVSVIALFVALGGSAYAAATIDSGDIVDNSVRSRDVKDHDLRTKDFRPGQLPHGVRAYATVDHNGPKLVTARSKGFVAVERRGDGIYCLTPKASIDARRSAPVASADAQNSAGRIWLVSAAAGTTACDLGQVEVETQTLPQGPVGDESGAVQANFIGFTVVVP